MLCIRAAVVLACLACAVAAQAGPGKQRPAPKAVTPQLPLKPAAAVSTPAKPAATLTAAANTPAPLPAPTATSAVDPLDWPSWRGPEQNGISREKGLPDKWDSDEAKPVNQLWKNPEAGGISTPIIMRGKLYTLVRSQPGTHAEGEKVLCLDAVTGKKLWENAFNVFLSDVPAERVGWSCCVGDPTTGRVFAMGVCGFMQCIDGETGKTIWSRSLSEEFGLVSTYGGRTNVPVIFDDLVIISAVVTGWGETAVPAHRFMAFDKNTGELHWLSGTKLRPEDTTYSTPATTVLAGQAAMVFGSGDGGVYAWQPRTGKPIWNFQISRRGLNVSPVVTDGVVYTSHAEENTDNQSTGGLFAINGSGKGDITASGLLWRAPGMAGKSSPVVVGGRMYACDDGGKVYVIDAKTGEEVCKPVKLIGTIVRASIVYGDGKLYVCSTNGWHILEPNEKGVKILQKRRLEDIDEISGSPIISHGRIYVTTGANLYCIGAADTKPAAADARPKLETEAAVADDQTPATLQVIPAESLIQPGDHVKLTARLFNAKGQFLKETPATYTLEGPGQVSTDGEYTAAAGTAHTGTIITAKTGELTAISRVRAVPPLPWKFSFKDVKLAKGMTGIEEGEPPITWIGARHRHKVRELDGHKVMVKVTTIPKGTRSQLWMGPNNLHDYTIQADLRGSTANNKVPDMGVVAQRYTLDLMGASQQVQIRSWTSQLGRFSKNAPFTWKPGVWYTLKLQAAAENGKAVLKGKVWPRDEKEPGEWTIEAVDETPNLTGSPGLFGNASDAEVYIDNVTVTPNAKG